MRDGAIMAIITFEVADHVIIEKEGKSPKSRLAFKAAGLDIYVKGSSSYHHSDCIPNLAMNACIARHIPVISLRRQK